MGTKVLCIIMLLVFFGVMVAVGIVTRKGAKDVDGFVLGKRSAGPWITAFAFGTSYFSAVIFVGYAGQFGWNFGMASTWIGLGNAFIGSLLAWNILGRRTRIMTQHLNAKTMPDFFGKRFNSTKMKVIASIIVFIFLIPYTSSLYNGLSSLFGLVFDIPYWVVIAIMAVLTGAYVIFGGYTATAYNDFIQGLIMLVGIAAVVGAVMVDNGGLTGSMQALSEVPAEGWTGGAFTSFLGPDPLALLFVVILTSLGTWGLPQMVNKFYAIKSEDDIHKGTVISTFFAIVVAGGCYYLGGFGRLYSDSVSYQADGQTPFFDSIIPTMLSTLPMLIIAVVIVLVLSASMSTLSSLVLTSASTLTLDVIKPATKDNLTERKQVSYMRLLIVFFILVSAVIAIVKDSHPEITFIAQMMGVSWGALAGAFLAPFLYGLYSKKVSRASCYVCFIWGCGLMVLQMIISLGGIDISSWPAVPAYLFASSIRSGVVAMAGSLIIVPVVSLFTKKQSKEEVDGYFRCYDEKIKAQISRKDYLED